jgi:transcriptional regulator with XRE-family HTH domain
MALTKPGYFGKTLKRIREERNLTQLQLAEATGISVDAVRQFEYGRRMPSYATLKLLSDAFGVSAAVWFDETPAKARGRKKADK